MPISRSNTLRSKSRSPAPPPLTPTPSSQRPFLPPSHYAAAGGLNTQSPVIQVESRESSHQKKRRLRQVDIKRNNVRNQVDTRPGPSDSESLISVENALSTSIKRQSSRSELTGLEAQLLPSLRDTIERMTGIPPRASSPFRTGTGNTELPIRGKANPSRRSSPDLRVMSEKVRIEVKQSKAQITSGHPTTNHDEGPATPTLSHIYSNQVTPTIGTAPLRLKTPAKSALKSSLRSPTPNSPKPSVVPVNSPSVAGSSLRTMKSLLTRKCSGTLRSPFIGSKPSNEGTRQDNRETVGVSPPSEVLFDNAQPGNRRQSEFESQYSNNFSTKKIFQSNIPRPRTRHYHNDPQEYQNPEDSDLDRRYDSEQRDRRKLTVANAEVPISMSSESEAESRRNFELENAITTGENLRLRESHSPVGLGLSMQKASSERRESSHPQPRDPQPRSDSVRLAQQEKLLRFSLPASESAGSSYSDEFSNYRPESYRRHSDPDSVNGDCMKAIQSTRFEDPRYRQRTTPPQSRRSSPSAVYGASTDEDTESEREGYSVWRKKSNERRQSPGGTSTLSAPPEPESDGFVPIVPPSPRSARRRYDSPSPHNSDGFAPNLRDLIKSRHSFTKPSFDPTHTSSHTTPRQWNGEVMKASIPQKPQILSPLTDSNRRYYRERSREEKERHGRTPASAIAEDYRSAAARERMAFGIPPSESDEVMNVQDQDQQLSSGESNMSSINASLWQEESDDLSEEAESIFRALNYSSKKGAERSNQKDIYYDSTPRLSVISPTLSSSSACGERGSTEHRPENGTIHNNVSKTREGVIQEIFESEEDLIRHLHICMTTFVLPLRVHNSRSWISGVPANVARLLDWFDDIVNLHEQVYDSLCSARDTMSPATDRVSESLRCFVLKVEVYQPYLVRLADVSEEIVRLIDDPQSDFGQFISIKQRSSESEGWTFERLLMLPVNRLAAYQDMFARLLDLTPKTHQDYLSTFSLSRSTDMVIRVMTEVKIREDEYNLLKTFSSRIQGLSFSNGLATRERRLLHSGPLALILSGLSEAFESSCKPGYQLQAPEFRRADRSSRLLDAISTSSSVLERTDSEKSASSFDGTSSGKGPAATSTPVKSSWFSRLPLRKRARPKSPLLPHDEQTHTEEAVQPIPVLTCLHTVPVHAFVFSDLVLLAQPGQTLDDKPRWIMSTDLGIFRPLSIAAIQDTKQEGTVLSLEALALDAENLNDSTDFRTTCFRTIDLLLPRTLPCNNNGSEDAIIDEISEPWILAFRQCSKTTLRKLTFLGLGTQHELSYGSDRTLDTFLAVSTLVGSGLPMPRSPSGQFPDGLQDKGEDLLGDERQERGWWSLRYQQVFREFQRQDSVLSDDDHEDVV